MSQIKYHREGFTKKEVFTNLGVNDDYARRLADDTNLALSDNTKSQYKTAIGHIDRAAAKLDTDMSLPFNLTKTLNYVGFLLYDREVCSKTVNQYLSAVRMLHLCQGLDISCLRPPVVALILKGREHWENVEKTLNQKPVRKAVTLIMMEFIKRAISEMSWSREMKRRVWVICCLLWSGSLRVHELLSKTKHEFDPLTTLCKEDVEILTTSVGGEVVTLVRLHLKSPKERRVGTGVKLEIFENKTYCCPVRAWQKWRTEVVLDERLPVFKQGDSCFTGTDFNRILTDLTSSFTNNTDGVIRPHSFRSGMASHMGLMGFSDKVSNVCLNEVVVNLPHFTGNTAAGQVVFTGF